MTLGQKQRLFSKLVGKLIARAYRQGYEISLGDAHRSVQEATRLGFPGSLHVSKLAIDLNLFRDGKYLSSTESHRPLGEWWEKQSGEDFTCAWGGRFGDGNHYSLAHAGKK